MSLAMKLTPRQQKMVDRGEAVVVYSVPGRTVRGTHYYQQVGILVSKEFADFLVADGDVTREK